MQDTYWSYMYIEDVKHLANISQSACSGILCWTNQNVGEV